MEKTNERITQLTHAGIELYQRCEQWRKALIKIQQLTDDPAILRIIKTNIGE